MPFPEYDYICLVNMWHPNIFGYLLIEICDIQIYLDIFSCPFYDICLQMPPHKCFKCWWLALPEKNRITKPLINSTFNHGMHEGPSYTVLTIITELLRQFES